VDHSRKITKSQMRQIIIILFVSLPFISAFGQIKRADGAIGGSVVSASGKHYHISVGQSDFYYRYGADLSVSEGFNQPELRRPLALEWRFESPECSNFMDGKIVLENIEGQDCDLSNIQFAWNGKTGPQTLTEVQEGIYTLQARTIDGCYFRTDISIVEDDFQQDCGLEFSNALVGGLTGLLEWH